MSYFSRYDKGEWATICDVCGRKFRNQDLRQRWDGLKTCNDDWEPRQPQDFVRGVADYQAPVWTRPETSDKFVPVTIIYDDYGNPLMPPVAETTTVSLSMIIYAHGLKLLRVFVTTAVSIVTFKFRQKPINASAINKTTLG